MKKKIVYAVAFGDIFEFFSLFCFLSTFFFFLLYSIKIFPCVFGHLSLCSSCCW